MKTYLYDGSFEGLLTSVFYAYPEKEAIQIQRKETYVPNLLDEVIIVATEDDKSNRVYDSIHQKLSRSTLENIYHLYLSELPDSETLIYQYIKLCFKHSDKINLAKHHDIIRLVDKYVRRVGHEAHRFTGFVRFKEVSPGIFYSQIEPDHHILPLIMSHFEARFSSQHFIIHDIKRELAIVYNQKEIYLTPLSVKEGDRFMEYAKNDTFEELFRSFYTSLTIEERINERRQRGLLPKRYWKHLTELQK